MKEKMYTEIIDGKEYRLVTLRNRSKLIASDGQAYNYYRRNQKVTTHVNSDGYLCFGGGIPVHLYVAYGWVDGYFDGAEVNHIDFDRQNNHADNLEWCTHADNIQKSVKYNSANWNASKQGCNNGRASFSESDIKAIRALYDSGNSISSIVNILYNLKSTDLDYKSKWSNISNICKRKTWKFL